MLRLLQYSTALSSSRYLNKKQPPDQGEFRVRCCSGGLFEKEMSVSAEPWVRHVLQGAMGCRGLQVQKDLWPFFRRGAGIGCQCFWRIWGFVFMYFEVQEFLRGGDVVSPVKDLKGSLLCTFHRELKAPGLDSGMFRNQSALTLVQETLAGLEQLLKS